MADMTATEPSNGMVGQLQLQIQQQAIDRQRRLAEMMQQQGMTPDQGQMISGHYVAPSNVSYLAKLAQTLIGKSTQNDLDQQQLGIAKNYDDGTMRLISALTGQNNQASQAQASAPTTQTAESVPALGDAPQSNTPASYGAQQAVSQPASAPAIRQGGPLANVDPTLAQLIANRTPNGIQKLTEAALQLQLKNAEDTNEMKNARWMNRTPQELAQEQRAAAKKAGMMEFQPGNMAIDFQNNQRIVAPDFKTGTQGGFDANGKPIMDRIQGSDILAKIEAEKAGAVTAATEAAKQPFGNPEPVNTPDGSRLMTPAQKIAYALGNTEQTSASSNNPGNLRPQGSSTGFQSFKTPEEGLAALDNNLKSYGSKGVNTISSIVSRWAPPSENNTAAYIADVSKRLGVNPDQQLDMNNPVVRQALSTAITIHENGSNKVFGQQSTKNTLPGGRLIDPAQSKVNEEKATAAINSAKVQESTKPLLAAIDQALAINEKVPYGPFGIAEGKRNISNLPVIGNGEASKYAGQWDQLMGQNIMNGIAASGLARMDIPIVNAIKSANGIPMENHPEARKQMLNTLRQLVENHAASASNIVPALNQPGITANTVTTPIQTSSQSTPSQNKIIDFGSLK